MKIIGINLTNNGNNVTSKIGSVGVNKVAIFNDTDGNIKDSGFTIECSVPPNASFTDTIYSHPTVSRTDTTSSVTVTSGGTVNMVDSITTNSLGHVTAINLKTLTMPTSTNYVHPSGDGNLHVPATGTTNNGKILKAGSTAGSLSWGTLTAADVGAAATSHVHTTSQISDATNINTANTIVKRDGSGNFNAGTITAALSGNASTATKLATARTINGTSFDGSANIVTANWGTSRNITIGNTAKSIDGSSNVSWSLAELGAASTQVVTTSVNGLMIASDKTKLDGIATNANNYIHPTGDGNNHIPTGGASDQFLKYSASGVAIWSALPSTDWANIINKPAISAGTGADSLMFSSASSSTASCSFAEGCNTTASGDYSHAEGHYANAKGIGSHAEGYFTNAAGNYSHAEGSNTKALNMYSHAEGRNTTAEGDNAHAEGNVAKASGVSSHAEGDNTIASGENAHAEGCSTTASGKKSHSEGQATIASGDYSHAEGYIAKSEGIYSHSEGYKSIALNEASHAEGYSTTAKGGYSHAEGYTVNAVGIASHAEGYTTTANGNYSHAEGSGGISEGNASHVEGYKSTSDKHIAYGRGSHVEGVDCLAGTLFDTNTSLSYMYTCAAHAEGCNTIAASEYSHAEGYGGVAHGQATHVEGYCKTAGKQIAYGRGSHVEGIDCIAGNSTDEISATVAAHAEGYITSASGCAAHAEGYATYATGNYSHAEGSGTRALGNNSHAEGSGCTAGGWYAHAEGYNTSAPGSVSHAEGYGTSAQGYASNARGYCTGAQGYAQTVIGQYNVPSGTSGSFVSTDAAFIIGNGTAASSTSNAYRILWTGVTYSKGAFNTSGADYAEMFEWNDGNPDNEERYGYFVTFDTATEKIRKANQNDDYILGVVSTETAILGDNFDEDWKDKYVRDKWGRMQYEKIFIEDKINEDGNVILAAHYEERPILNTTYDPNAEYIGRDKRKEWAPIGLLGKLLVHDDGTCEVGGYCMPNKDGIATKSNYGYRVLSKKDNIVKILFK